MQFVPKKKISSFRIIIFGFMGVILAGALLLMLPFSTREWGGAGFFDALFTATSAVCVTGLVVQDTATYWSAFGQTVILLMIQVGGLGVVTVGLAAAMVSGRRIGLKQRTTMQEAISAPQMGGVVQMIGFILKGVLLFELLGTLLLAFAFCPEFGPKGIWYALFHSVSAFCNAGFDLMGIKGQYSSLTSYSAHPLVNVVIIVLIVIGGIGFFTWHDIKTHRLKFRRYRLQSKVALSVTAVLILLPTLWFFFFEFTSLGGGHRFLASLFQSVTLRTAGFNTVDFGGITETGLLLMIMMMLIGGSPGSTAGGMKTTTAAVLLASAVSVFRRRANAQFFHRRVEDTVVKNAAAILLLYLVSFLGGGMIISTVEGIPILTALFETASAVGTVGLSLGITPQLGGISRAVLILLMYMGRVGGLTLIYAALSGTPANLSKYPQEHITVG